MDFNKNGFDYENMRDELFQGYTALAMPYEDKLDNAVKVNLCFDKEKYNAIIDAVCRQCDVDVKYKRLYATCPEAHCPRCDYHLTPSIDDKYCIKCGQKLRFWGEEGFDDSVMKDYIY